MTDTTADLADAPEPTAVVDEQSTADPIEALAAQFGHKPKTDDWEGEWDDPITFLSKVPDRLEKAKREATEAKEAAKRTARMAEVQMREAKKRLQKDFDTRLEQAWANNDLEAAKEVVAEQAKLNQGIDPAITAFKAEHTWLETHPEAAKMAAMTTQISYEAGKSVPEQLEDALATVQRAYPELFEDKAEKAPRKVPLVAQNARQPASRPVKKGLSDVPPHIRAAWTPSYCKTFQTTPEECAKIFLEGQS